MEPGSSGNSRGRRNQPLEPSRVENDLREEVEESDAEMDQEPVPDSSADEMEVEESDKRKLSRSRPKPPMDGDEEDELERPKRRRVSQEHLEESQEEEDEGDESREQEVLSAAPAEEDKPGPSRAMYGRESSSQRVEEDRQGGQSSDHELRRSFASYSRSAEYEELFRLPIYEADDNDREGFSRERTDANRNYRERGNNNEEEMQARDAEGEGQAPGDGKDLTAKDNERMIFARRLLFSTTDLIFPGFAHAINDKVAKYEKQYRAVRLRSSWVLQALLYAESLFFTLWVLAFVFTVDISMSVLKDLHGNLVVCMSALFMIVNVPRIMFGFRGNERDKLELLALFWMTTLIVQVPLLGFVLFTDYFTPITLPFTTAMDTTLMGFVLLELIVSTAHLKKLVTDELRVIKLAKMIGRQATPPRRESAELVQPAPVGPPEANQQENEEDDRDSDWSTDDEKVQIPGLGYRMRTPRMGDYNDDENEDEEVSDTEEQKDDTNVVTSTSDSIRHRSVRVH